MFSGETYVVPGASSQIKGLVLLDNNHMVGIRINMVIVIDGC